MPAVAPTPTDMEQMVAEIDLLVEECERAIVGLGKKDEDVRQWFLGARYGLLLAQAFARRVWPKDGR